MGKNTLLELLRYFSKKHNIDEKTLLFFYNQGFYTGKIAGLRYALHGVETDNFGEVKHD